ncbi:M16 family metallopeptidase [Treponema zioleckii]|uniref:M16 family metallopeptidase n=1 Tax=Treponema zioleckii TaxID=331680 RepID=UPI00168BCA29|nr:insulinase family protein [Treponema zioleckii]
MKISKIILAAFSAFLVSALSISCASSPKSEPYYDNNINDFSYAKLSNGINVVFKKNVGSKIAVARMLIEGGVPFISPEKSGLEDITLQLMLHGSKNYPYADLQKLSYDKSFSIGASSGKDFSAVALVCIKRDIEETLGIFADNILNPLFLEKDFEQQMTDEKASVHRTLASPESLLSLSIAKNVYKNHQYASFTSATEESLKNIKLDDVKNLHKELLNSKRISFVIVGNFSSDEQSKITSILDKYFGSLQEKPYARPEISDLTCNGENVYISNEQAGEIGYIAGIFKCPERTSEEYVPFAITEMYLDDILFAEVREKHSALYSVGCGIIGGRKLLGAISLYKVTEKENIKKIVYDALNSFPKTEAEIEEKLDNYKNKYITSLFSSSQNSSGIASNISSSLIYRDSATQYLHRSAEVQAVTAKQILAVYKKYFSQEGENPNHIRWIILSGKDSVNQFKF